MKDKLGRTIDYMRISITDRCNLRCSYCMPHDLQITDMSEILTFEEILLVAEAAAALGISHLRVTGGEPLARRGATELVRMLKQVPGIETVKMTTNGVELSENAAALAGAGLDGLNISLDVMDAESFRALTGRDFFGRVMAGIDAAVAAGIPIKFNAVTLPETDPMAMIRFAEEKNAPIRFIEMMPIGQGSDFVGRSNRELMREIAEACGGEGEEGDGTAASDGPATYLRFPGITHPVGFISPMTSRFCGRCNRVRLTSQGYLKLCLCYGDGLDLRELIRKGIGREELSAAIQAAVLNKPAEHCFEHAERITELRDMSKIGG